MKPNCYLSEDGEQVIEWIGESGRFGLIFDADGTSSWFYVSKWREPQSGNLEEEVLVALDSGIRKATEHWR